jgi:DNA-binding CsgD family transcriptional regulator
VSAVVLCGLEVPVEPVGVGIGASYPIPALARQRALDAGAILQLRGTELATAVARGPVPGVEIIGRGQAGVNAYTMRSAHQWRDLLSVRQAGPLAHLRLTVPNNRAAIENGLRMISVFDHDGLPEASHALLAGERLGTYLIGIAKVQMKIVDRTFVLLQGPVVDGEITVMAVREPRCLAAAWEYWHRIMDSAYPVADHPSTHDRDLSVRQQQIVALLAADANDDAIASTLGVSVRTVRSDIAEVMRILGVRSRFAAGIRFREITEATG